MAYSQEDELIRRMMSVLVRGARSIQITNAPLPPLPKGVVPPPDVTLPAIAAAATTVTVDGITYELKATVVDPKPEDTESVDAPNE